MSTTDIIPINVRNYGLQMTRYLVGLDGTLQSANVNLNLMLLQRAPSRNSTPQHRH